jgi:peptidoglycan-associated lipoprotein
MTAARRGLRVRAFTAAALLAACAAPRPALKTPRDAEAEAAQKAAADKAAADKAAAEAAPAAPETDMTEASLRSGGDFLPRADLKPVPFDYDSAQLSEDARAALKANAEVIKADAALEVMVAGHCDERGTVAYNLALGQKRAKEVRDYYMRLGISGGRIATISYGKEQPLCLESGDACWSQNRRAETRARSRKPAAAPFPASR